MSIDIVILNAATFGLPWTLTENGLETTFQVNFLSQYYLLLSIEKILSPNARVVFTSSESHRNVELSEGARVFPSLDHFSLSAERYTSIRAYNLSKVCGVLAARYLHQRWLHAGPAVFCAHPGSFVKTGLCRNWWVFEALYTAMLPFSKSIGQAASTIVYCATSPELAGQSGFYFKDCRRCEPSELAGSTYLAYRMHDLACDVLRQRGFYLDVNTASQIHETEHEMEEQIC
ncbi:WW domain-containing oxidoreductase-like isoform X2 [Aricia agestis]|uniref:WW domain-containing oxidoreductase-like isoform X2 n=1 Tax=Aricia agestis TaxID=91739 RepID=UPI001C2088F7|nr:WW domain-containing oxidoreductase-like isoform X2 [Aricia agestis]